MIAAGDQVISRNYFYRRKQRKLSHANEPILSDFYRRWPSAAEPQPNRSWILQEAAEDTAELINRRCRAADWSRGAVSLRPVRLFSPPSAKIQNFCPRR